MYVVGCDTGESKRYRVHNLVEVLCELGYAAVAIPDFDIDQIIDSETRCGTLVLFRCAWDPHLQRLITYCRSKGIKVVFDIDDLVFEPDQIDLVRVVATFTPSAREQYRDGVRRYRQTLLECDYATCTTAYLAERIGRLDKSASVIPNSLNREQIEIGQRLAPRVPDGTVRIGYFSGSNTHQVDFQDCEEALLQILDSYGCARFILVGVLELGSKWEKVADRVERVPFLRYDAMLQILAGIDINLAPLERGNPYCEGKSQLKIFEAGSVGVPTIATDVASYSEAITHGVDGLLARSAEDWNDCLASLLASPDLRRSLGLNARERALRQFGPETLGASARSVYGLESNSSEHGLCDPSITVQEEQPDYAPNMRRSSGNGIKITWILPELIIGGGGHRNILRAAYLLQKFGHELELYFTNTRMTEGQLRAAVTRHFYPLQCPMRQYRGSIQKTDVLLATHWSTVDPALRNRTFAREVMYFVQDFEPAFAPAGTEYVLAENTYRLGLYHIASGPWCENILRSEFQAEVDHFVFPVDRATYRPGDRTRPNKNLLFFAKPEMPRRCYELGVLALEKFHTICPDVEIILFGSRSVDPSAVPFPCSVRHVLPSIQDLASMYASADVGMVFSTTNPSLVPYEMMACGLPVVDLDRGNNHINYGGRYDVALLANPQPSVMAAQIAKLIKDPDELSTRARNGLSFVKTFPSEEEMGRRVEELILRRLAKQRQNAQTLEDPQRLG